MINELKWVVRQTALWISLAPGKLSGGYGRSSCSDLLNFERTCCRGLLMIFSLEGSRASLATATTASVAMMEEPKNRDEIGKLNRTKPEIAISTPDLQSSE